MAFGLLLAEVVIKDTLLLCFDNSHEELVAEADAVVLGMVLRQQVDFITGHKLVEVAEVARLLRRGLSLISRVIRLDNLG